jgi:anti-sigma B factor antagonist
MNPVPFAVKSRTQGNTGVIAVSGELDLHTAAQLEASLNELLEDDGRGLAIDLSACTFIDSTGIALIVRAWRQLDGDSNGASSGRFALIGLSDQVRRLFDITGLKSRIPMHATIEEALDELGE